MNSVSSSKRTVRAMGARGGSRTGHRSGFGSGSSFRPPLTSRSMVYSSRCHKSKEHIDMNRTRSSGPGVFESGQLDKLSPVSDDDVDGEDDHKTKPSFSKHPSSFIPEKENAPANIASSKTYRRCQTSGVAQGISALTVPTLNSRHHIVSQHTEKSSITLQQALNLSPSPQSGKNFFSRHLQLKILDKSPKRSNESSSSIYDDYYIAMAADTDVTYKGPSPSAQTHCKNKLDSVARKIGDPDFRSSTNSSLNSSVQVGFSETLSAGGDMRDMGGVSANHQSIWGLRQRPPQSSAASTKSTATTESTESTNSSRSATTSLSSTQSYHATDESLVRDQSDDESSDEDDRMALKQLRERASRFICPFHMHDPQKFNKGACAFSSWKSISRLKEHLYRRHTHVCQRCNHAFKNHNALVSHMTQTEACEPGVWVTEGITPAIEKKIRSRKKANGDKSEGESWEAIYKLLFPGEDVPLPHFRTSQQKSLESLNYRFLTSIEHLRRELPNLVRNSDDTQNLGEDALERLILNMNDRISQVFAPYGSYGGPLRTGNSAPVAKQSAKFQVDKTNASNNEGLSEIQPANPAVTFPTLSQVQLPNDHPDQGSTQLQMNVEASNGKNYLEPFTMMDVTSSNHQALYDYPDGTDSYSSNAAVSKFGFQEMNNRSPDAISEQAYCHDYDHNMSQQANNSLTHHSRISDGTSMALFSWDQPNPLDIMDNVSF